MDHEAAKAALTKAEGMVQRIAAVSQALNLGMNLREIEDHLDWLDANQAPVIAPENLGWVAWFAGWWGNLTGWGNTSRRFTTEVGTAFHPQSPPPAKPR
jgi:hypothetical protein